MLIADTPVLLPQVEAGRMQAIAVLGTQRTPLLPELPTAVEQGHPSLVMENWYGVLAPSGVPAERQNLLERAIVAAMTAPELQERFAAAGLAGGTGAEGFRAQIAADNAYWPALLRQMKITLD